MVYFLAFKATETSLTPISFRTEKKPKNNSFSKLNFGKLALTVYLLFYKISYPKLSFRNHFSIS